MTKHLKNRPVPARRQGLRLAVLVGLLASLAVSAAVPSAARAGAPVRSGTIVGGVDETPISPWVRGMEGCVGAPSCSAWLQSGCDPALTGIEPGPQAAIVDVEDLSDGATERSLELRGGLGSGIAVLNRGNFLVQFWTESDLLFRWKWCREIVVSRLSSWDCERDRSYLETRCTFLIPADAKWMTISSSPENTQIRWTLT